VRSLADFSANLARLAASAMRGVVTIFGRTSDGEVAGSGFLIDAHGHIVTNNHVIEDVEPPLDVVLHGDIRRTASVLGSDPWTDLALLRVDRPIRAHLRLRSAPARLGELCLALGSPLGVYPESASIGVVSGIARTIPQEVGRPIFHAIQTDCAINPGNSGGPLVDARGLVLGANNCCDARAANIGFAVPAETIQAVLADLQKSGRVVRATLDVTVTRANVAVEGKTLAGLQVVKAPKGPGAHFRPGDVILRIGGRRVRHPHDIFSLLTKDCIGRPMPIEVVRRGERRQLTVHPRELRHDSRV
jgi:S1-C subfamily serine protease